MKKISLLILDDEQEVLNALRRVLRNDFELFLFMDVDKALEFYKKMPIPLVLSDMRMPVMDGAAFLSEIAKIYPYSKRFILTGYADIELIISAVNEGKISFYFNKPWDNDILISSLKEAFEVYKRELMPVKLLRQNKLKSELLVKEVNNNKQKLQKSLSRLKNTFSKFIDIYANMASLHTQDRTGHNQRIAMQARYLAELSGCDKLSCHQIYFAGLLYETGKITLPQTLLQQSYEVLNKHQQTLYNTFYQQAETLMSPIEELTYLVNLIKHIPEQYNGLGFPEHIVGQEIPLGSRILAVVTAFDNLLIGRQLRSAVPFYEARKLMESQADKQFDPVIVKLFCSMLNDFVCYKEGELEYAINIDQLSTGMVLTQNLQNEHNAILLTKGMKIEKYHIDKLSQLNKQQNSDFILFVTNE